MKKFVTMIIALSIIGCSATDEPNRPATSCGNDTIDAPEQCDGDKLNDQTCQTLGFASGVLSCHPDICQFVTSGCFNDTVTCGDGIKQEGEQCDGQDTTTCPDGSPRACLNNCMLSRCPDMTGDMDDMSADMRDMSGDMASDMLPDMPSDMDPPPDMGAGDMQAACMQGQLRCDGACADCPSGDGILSYACQASACVIERCNDGFVPCNGGCCMPQPASSAVLSNTQAEVVSIAVNASGYPAILYSTDNITSMVHLARWDGAQWSTQTLKAGRVAGANAIAFDSNDNIHVLFKSANGKSLSYGFFNGTRWRYDVIDVVDETKPVTAVLRLSQDEPFIAYNSSNRVLFAERVAGAWTTTSLGGRGSFISHLDFKLIDKQPPSLYHIVTVSESGGDAYLTYSERKSTNMFWKQEVIVNTTPLDSFNDQRAFIAYPYVSAGAVRSVIVENDSRGRVLFYEADSVPQVNEYPLLINKNYNVWDVDYISSKKPAFVYSEDLTGDAYLNVREPSTMNIKFTMGAMMPGTNASLAIDAQDKSHVAFVKKPTSEVVYEKF